MTSARALRLVASTIVTPTPTPITLSPVLIKNGPEIHPVGPGGEGVLLIMHGRSRRTVDPRIPTMPGRSTSGFHRPVACSHQARSETRGVGRVARRVRAASSDESLLRRIFLHVDDKRLLIIVYLISGVATSRDSDGVYYVTASWVPYHTHTTRYVIRSKSSHRIGGGGSCLITRVIRYSPSAVSSEKLGL